MIPYAFEATFVLAPSLSKNVLRQRGLFAREAESTHFMISMASTIFSTDK